MNDERLAVATRWVVVVGFAIVTIGSYWLTFQPERPFGPVPILVLLADFIVGIGAIPLGTGIARRLSLTGRLPTFLAQVGSIAVFATLGIVVGYAADPSWWDVRLVQTYYELAFIYGTPLLGLSHLTGILNARLTRD